MRRVRLRIDVHGPHPTLGAVLCDVRPDPDARWRRVLDRPDARDTDDDICRAVLMLLGGWAPDRVTRVACGERSPLRSRWSAPVRRAFGLDAAEAIGVRSGDAWFVASWVSAPVAEARAQTLAMLRRAARARADRELLASLARFRSDNDAQMRHLAHEVSNALFPVRLALAVLERQGGPAQQLAVVRKGADAALAHVRNAADPVESNDQRPVGPVGRPDGSPARPVVHGLRNRWIVEELRRRVAGVRTAPVRPATARRDEHGEQ